MTNETVLEKIEEKRSLHNNLLHRKAKWIGNTLRHESLLFIIIEGAIEGSNSRGRPRAQLIRELNFPSYFTMKRVANNREEWRRICHRLIKPATPAVT